VNNKIRTFRIIAIAEGVSFLALLLIAMPLKYFANLPEAVKITGWIHGVLFVLYIPAVFLVRSVMRWSIFQLLMALVASVLPGGTFVVDNKLIRKEN
jgi:integral membrane protein